MIFSVSTGMVPCREHLGPCGLDLLLKPHRSGFLPGDQLHELLPRRPEPVVADGRDLRAHSELRLAVRSGGDRLLLAVPAGRASELDYSAAEVRRGPAAGCTSDSSCCAGRCSSSERWPRQKRRRLAAIWFDCDTSWKRAKLSLAVRTPSPDPQSRVRYLDGDPRSSRSFRRAR